MESLRSDRLEYACISEFSYPDDMKELRRRFPEFNVIELGEALSITEEMGYWRHPEGKPRRPMILSERGLQRRRELRKILGLV